MINGNLFRNAVISASNCLANRKNEIDELNVFPVPDGDTGTNMSMTMSNASRRLVNLKENSLSKVADETASCLLRGARGNSGVILSLLFRGISKGFKGLDEADGKQLAAAYQVGVDSAYKAVMKPTEGTILTVARLSAVRAAAAAEENNDPVYVFGEICKEAEAVLAQTPEMLPGLKKAGVVDSGGKGLTVILNAMYDVLSGGAMVELAGKGDKEEKKSVIATLETEITFTYCTEFIVSKDKSLDKNALGLRAYLETIGDSCVVVDDDDIVKIHVHTDNPGNALQEGLKYGQLTSIKIENMRDQNEKIKHDADQSASTSTGEQLKSVKPEKPYGFVVVAAGEGLEQLFTELGADHVVRGGQTMNPSTDDILMAVEATPAETVFVFPNNKNIIMAAEQAVPFATRKLVVIPTRSIPMGISAMLAFDEDANEEDNLMAMTAAADHVGTGMVTYAVRDSEYDGHKIRKGEIMGIQNGKVTVIEQEISKAVVKLSKALTQSDTAMITLFYGAGVSEEEANAVCQEVQQKVGNDIEVSALSGGQPVYYYIISVE